MKPPHTTCYPFLLSVRPKVWACGILGGSSKLRPPQFFCCAESIKNPITYRSLQLLSQNSNYFGRKSTITKDVAVAGAIAVLARFRNFSQFSANSRNFSAIAFWVSCLRAFW